MKTSGPCDILAGRTYGELLFVRIDFTICRHITKMSTHQEGAEKTKDCLIYQQKITCKLRENFLPFSLWSTRPFFSFKLVMPMRD